MAAKAANLVAVGRAGAAPYLLALLAMGGFTCFQQTPLPIVLGIMGTFLAWLTVESPRGKAIPKTIINTAVVCATIFLWAEIQQGDHNFVAALGHFITLLLLCKFLEPKDARDLYQIVILSMLLMVASAMYASTIIFAVVLVAYVVVLVYCMILFQMRQSMAAGQGFGPLTGTPLAHDAPFMRDIRKAAFRGMMVLIPIALAVFLLLPRARGNAVFSRFGTGGGTFETGFSENIQFHDYGTLAQSDEVVMDVKISRHGENAGSEWFEPYFRGQILDTYDFKTKQWTHPVSLANANTASLKFADGAGVILPQQADNPNRIIQQYTLYHTVRRILFEMIPPVSISSDDIKGVWFDKNNVTFNALATDVPTVQYTVASLPTFGSPVLPAPAARLTAMTIPPEITALAHRILRDTFPGQGPPPSPAQIRAIVETLENYLRTTYPYSLSFQQHDPHLDPIVDFLLNRKDTGGHCEYFAAAMVMLCRSTGLNARIVNGYRGVEFNSIGGYYVVRQKDAHAWAEVYIPGEGWLQSDPSPVSIVQNPSDSFIRHWGGEMAQFVENLWEAAVISFDDDSQHSVLAWLEARLKGPRAFFADWWKAIAFSVNELFSDSWMRLSLLVGLLPAAGVVMIGRWTFKRWSRERRQYARIGALRKPVRLSANTLFLDELFRLIARHAPGGLAARLPHQTPREFIEGSVSFLGNAAPDARWLVTTFYALQFGSSRQTAELKSQIATALRRVKDALQESIKSHKTGPAAAGERTV